MDSPAGGASFDTVGVLVRSAPDAPVSCWEEHPLDSEDTGGLTPGPNAAERMCMTATLWTVSSITSIEQLKSALNLLASKEPVSSDPSVSSLILRVPSHSVKEAVEVLGRHHRFGTPTTAKPSEDETFF